MRTILVDLVERVGQKEQGDKDGDGTEDDKFDVDALIERSLYQDTTS
jgi:hypothetical protein